MFFDLIQISVFLRKYQRGGGSKTVSVVPNIGSQEGLNGYVMHSWSYLVKVGHES